MISNGTIQTNESIENGLKAGWCVIKVEEVFAPSTKTKHLRVKRKYSSLKEAQGNSRTLPFTAPIPISMLRSHVPNGKHLIKSKQQQRQTLREMSQSADNGKLSAPSLPSEDAIRENPLGNALLNGNGDNVDNELDSDGEVDAGKKFANVDNSIQDRTRIADIEKSL